MAAAPKCAPGQANASMLRASLADVPATAHIRGVIRSDGGGSIAGARVWLRSQDGSILAETLTGPDGSYALDELPSGSETLSVSMQGFLQANYPVRLPDEGGTAVVNIALKLEGTSDAVTVTATQQEVAEAQLRLQEQQRLAGIFPNFFVSYQWQVAPLRPSQKFRLAWKNASDPGNLLLVAATAGLQQATDSFPGYGQGAAGYGQRVGADLGNLVAGTFLGGAVLPSLFHQDPRYFYKGTGSTSSRFWYAVSRAVVTRGDNGKMQPNWSGVLGDLSAGAISNLYYAPEDRKGARLTLENGLLGVGGDALNGIFQEFVLRKLTTHTKGRRGAATQNSE